MDIEMMKMFLRLLLLMICILPVGYIVNNIIYAILFFYNKNKCINPIKGIVVDVKRRYFFPRRISQYPIIEYEIDGEKYTSESKFVYSLTKYRTENIYEKGQEIEIVYNADNPKIFMIENKKEKILFSVVFKIMAIIFLAIYLSKIIIYGMCNI